MVASMLAADIVGGEDEVQLVHAAQSEPSAFAALYKRYLPRIFRYLRAHTSNPLDAADLTQQVFLNALEALPRYQSRGVPFAAWLFRIARNAIVDYYRRRGSTVQLRLTESIPTDAPDPEVGLLQQERLARLDALVSELDADKRELLVLRFAGGLSAREIALVVDRSQAAVKKQLTRTIEMLREQYDEKPS